MERKHLIQICQEVLDSNQNGRHTMPAPDLYPHQWLWDSCFIAIGLRHYETERAQDEILELLKGQWSNGMIPHMIFDTSNKYKNDRDIWRSYVSPYSPKIATSGITQPPVIAEAVYRIGQKLRKSEAVSFYKKVLPALISHHMWLMTERDPHEEGLTLQIHPWETGLDNTPPWMNQLHEHSKPWWISLIEKLRLDSVINLVRRDTRHLPPGQRITNTEALIVFDMIRRFRRKAYDINKVLHRSMFCIEDVGFNSILARNNQLIVEIAEKARYKLPTSFLDKIETQKLALLKCWDEQDGYYYSRDFITHELLRQPTISSLLPLYSGVISQEHANRLVECLNNHKVFGLNHPVPSVPLSNPQFNALRYWQGPSWINTNWLLIDGLKRYGFNELASSITVKTIDLVNLHGPNEYFSAIDGSPLGAQNFSWSASLILDLLHNQ
jgi:hypothetical protein